MGYSCSLALCTSFVTFLFSIFSFLCFYFFLKRNPRSSLLVPEQQAQRLKRHSREIKRASRNDEQRTSGWLLFFPVCINMGNTTTIPLVFNTNCSLPGEPGPTCYHFLPCNAVTRNCECGSIPYTLCSQPLRYNDTYLQANFLAVKVGEKHWFCCRIFFNSATKGVIFSLQGIVVILSIALLIGHVVKRGKFFVKPTREQAALCVVLCCAGWFFFFFFFYNASFVQLID